MHASSCDKASGTVQRTRDGIPGLIAPRSSYRESYAADRAARSACSVKVASSRGAHVATRRPRPPTQAGPSASAPFHHAFPLIEQLLGGRTGGYGRGRGHSERRERRPAPT